jgi:hypothetical protein
MGKTAGSSRWTTPEAPRRQQRLQARGAAARDVLVKTQERERHPLRRQDLDVRELARAIRREPEGKSRAQTSQHGAVSRNASR